MGDIIKMIYFIIAFLALILLISLFKFNGYNSDGFNRKGIHLNGTRYDDDGYDCKGYNKNGYNRKGYNKEGYDYKGYNYYGYTIEGKNINGQYNRLFDKVNKDGFSPLSDYPIIITTHAKQRIVERIPPNYYDDINTMVYDAYCYGKSKYQVKKSSAQQMETYESRYDSSRLLIYRGYIYVFSTDNKLITVYKNNNIIL